MARASFFNVHRTWEDWLGMLLGVLVVLSPAVAAGALGDAASVNAGVVGMLVFALSALELVDLRRWEEGIELVLGLWLMASPFVFGYSGAATLFAAHLALGALVALLAIIELWQDWKLSEGDLARYGH